MSKASSKKTGAGTEKKSAPKPVKPLRFEGERVTYRKTDKFGRMIFTITEPQYDVLYATATEMSSNAPIPIYIDDFDGDQFSLRGKWGKKLKKKVELSEGVMYNMHGIMKRAMMGERDEVGEPIKGSKRIHPVVYIQISQLIPTKENKDEDEEPAPKKQKKSNTKVETASTESDASEDEE
jgi:hypothetical protein